MFFGCKALKELNINNFNTENADVKNMFCNCSVELIKKIKMKYKNIPKIAFCDYS